LRVFLFLAGAVHVQQPAERLGRVSEAGWYSQIYSLSAV